MAYESTSGFVARLGFAAQGTVWLSLVIAGVRAIRRKDRARHASLMLAMAAVASGAIWVRLTTAVATSYDLPFAPVYACSTWLGWLRAVDDRSGHHVATPVAHNARRGSRHLTPAPLGSSRADDTQATPDRP